MTQTPKRTSRPVGTEETRQRRKLPVGLLLIGGAAIIVVLLVVLLVVANQPRPVSAEAYAGYPDDWVGRRVLGNPEAPVVIQGWEDFRCPACSQWTQVIKPQLMQNYISPEAPNGGQVRFEYHYFPLTSHGETAILAAQAAECAADQGAFWVYHDRLFTATNDGPAGFTLDQLGAYATELGLDANRLTQCVVSQEYFDEVQASVAEAIALRLDSTPSILVNGRRFAEPFNYQALTDEINQQASQAQ